MRISDWSSDVCSSDLVDHERLAAEDGHEANALLSQPQKRGEGLGDQTLAERAIRAIAGKAEHVVIERRRGIAPEDGAGGFRIGEVRHQAAEVGGTIVGAPHARGRYAGDAAALLLRCTP